MNKALTLIATIILTLSIATAHAWDPREVDKLGAGSDEAKQAMLEKDPSMQIIPTVGKGGIGIGGARGKGLLYEGGKPSAIVTLTQLTVGFQWGGQTYSEFIFFKDGDALDKFKSNNYELGAQASAVAVTAGASADANYSEGVAVFTQAKGGLMYEATVGGQKFKVEMLEGDQ